jgi:probable phosphoglycerate mutase
MLILIRHGESLANAQGRLSGWQNVALTQKGRYQAAESGKLLADHKCVSVISSDLIRAQETAKIAMREWSILTGMDSPEIKVLGSFRERRMGAIQGHLKKNLRRANRLWMLKTWKRAPINGESFHQLAERVLPSLINVPPQSFIFAHGGVIRMIAGIAKGMPMEKWMRWDVPNAKPMIVHPPKEGWAKAFQALFEKDHH